MLIKDIVHLDEHGAFRSDVQLSDYDNPKLNLQLLRNYIFTVSAPATSRAGRDVSAKDVLDRLKTAFTVERYENRMVLIANYGRGKSHLALTLANFFSRPVESEEIRIIFERLRQALNKPAALSGYRDFKQTKGEFLVVRLRGDGFDDLQEGFMQALEQALSEHECTRGIELPFWHEKAKAWLDALSGENSQKAETFLARHNTDLATLRQDLRKRGAYELVRETAKFVTGLYPDFGREVSLKDLVLWAVDEVCVPNKMGGLLVLFDEFSLFLQKYAASRTVGKLQDLLNGISDRRGKSAFLAFAQIELESVLETYTQGARRDDVKKELERLPVDKRARLFSLMESVLDAYLKQNEAAWKVWLKKQRIHAAMVRNGETLYEYFAQRYEDVLRWEIGKTRETVVKGCFPLHPLTTAILSTHTFEAGAGENARTALHFLRDRWEKDLPEKPAEREDGEPNFVFPAELVDFFGEQISKKWYEAYRTALENARIPLTGEHRAALKALLLQQAVSDLNKKKASGGEQLDLLSALCGLNRRRLKVVLREMSDNRILEYDPYRKVSSLLPAGIRSLETDKIIEKAIQKIPLDLTLLTEIAKSIPPLEIAQDFGHADDWAPRQVFLTEEFFTVETLKNLSQPYRVGRDGLEESPRGLVIWLLAQTEEEKMHLRQNAQKVLDKALAGKPYPLPVVILLPRQPNPGLLQSARRKKALETLSRSDREKIGTIGYESEKRRAWSDFRQNFTFFIDPEHYADLPRSLHDIALPAPYRAAVEVLKNPSLKNIVSTLYRKAYAYRIDFYTQYSVTSRRGPNKLRDAVRKVARGLFADAIAGSLASLGKRDIQAQISNNYLSQKWGLLSVDTHTIHPPTSQALREAWNRLEDAFPPGCKETRAHDVLLELLNPPYGHDYNTLTLLLAAWIGYHRHEIRISLSGKLVSLENFKNYFDETKNPKDFLDRLIVTSPLAVSRIDTNEMFAEIDAILEQIRQNQPFSMTQAQQALAKLEQAQENPNLPPSRKNAIETYAPRLQQALSKTREYNEQVTVWLNKLRSADFNKLFELREQLEELPKPMLVSPTQPATDVLLQKWEKWIEQEIDIVCEKYSQLENLGDYNDHQAQLRKAQRSLKQYPRLRSKVEEALLELNRRRDELRQAANEKPIVAEINGMVVSAGLADLYRYQARLTEFKNLSPKTEEMLQQKRRQIQSRIQQFEQLAKMLPPAIEKADSLITVRKQKEILLRNLEQTQETSIYDTLITLQQRIQALEEFFEQLRALSNVPQTTPEDLASAEGEIAAIEKQFAEILSPVQKSLLEQKRREIDAVRRQAAQKAHQWLVDLQSRVKTGEDPEIMLRETQNPPAFLSVKDRSQLDEIRQSLQRKIEKDHVLKIEMLFKKLAPEARYICLKRLQDLMDS